MITRSLLLAEYACESGEKKGGSHLCLEGLPERLTSADIVPKHVEQRRIVGRIDMLRTRHNDVGMCMHVQHFQLDDGETTRVAAPVIQGTIRVMGHARLKLQWTFGNARRGHLDGRKRVKAR